MNFSVSVVPDIEAKYVGGYQELKQYLSEKAIDKIPEIPAGQIQQTVVKFVVNEEGESCTGF